jgi:hypothetical protein
LNACFAEEFARAGITLVEETKSKPRRRVGPIDPASLYEVRIVERGEVPSRPRNAHDLLNALVWAAFPHAKLALTRALAAIQRERAIADTATNRTVSNADATASTSATNRTLPNARTPEHDRLALVDEGAILYVGEARWIFGHALYEHAYASLDARGAIVDLDVPGIADRDAVDHALAVADLSRAVRSGPGVACDFRS